MVCMLVAAILPLYLLDGLPGMVMCTEATVSGAHLALSAAAGKASTVAKARSPAQIRHDMHALLVVRSMSLPTLKQCVLTSSDSIKHIKQTRFCNLEQT